MKLPSWVMILKSQKDLIKLYTKRHFLGKNRKGTLSFTKTEPKRKLLFCVCQDKEFASVLQQALMVIKQMNKS
jgi:hypothetical protein